MELFTKISIMTLGMTNSFSLCTHCSATSDQHLLVVFVPGNPGTVEFYSDFLHDIHTALVKHRGDNLSSITTRAVSHFNHHLGSSLEQNSFEILDFAAQINHQRGFIEDWGNSTEKLEIVFLCHSIGAYIVNDILLNSTVARLTSDVVLLMPFIFWSNLPTLHRFKLAIYKCFEPLSFRFAKTIFDIYSALPKAAKVWLVSCCVIDEECRFFDMVISRLLTKRLFSNFLSMGSTEIVAVKASESKMIFFLEDVDNRKPFRVHAVYTTNDVWATRKDFEMLTSIMPNNKSRIFFIPDLTHAFTMQKATSDIVTRIVTTSLLNHDEVGATSIHSGSNNRCHDTFSTAACCIESRSSALLRSTLWSSALFLFPLLSTEFARFI